MSYFGVSTRTTLTELRSDLSWHRVANLVQGSDKHKTTNNHGLDTKFCDKRDQNARHGQVVGVEKVINLGSALPAPTITMAVAFKTGGVNVAPFPTIPAPRLTVITPSNDAEDVSAVVGVFGVATAVVMVGAVGPGFIILTRICADCPHAREINGVMSVESEIVGGGVIIGGVGRTTVPGVFDSVG